MNQLEKKRLWLFVAINYGITYLMGVLMYIGAKQQIDLSCFANTQMMYPAFGVVITLLVTSAKEDKLPRGAYWTVIVSTVLLMVLSVVSIVAPMEPTEIAGMALTPYTLALNYILIVGSVVLYVFTWACGKEKRNNGGFARKNIWLSVGIVALFIVVYLLRLTLAFVIDGVRTGNGMADFLEWIQVFTMPQTWSAVVALPLNFFFVFICFLGEEYGWRFFLQPLLQKRFGKRLGVLILGIVWGLWHLPMDMCYYTSTTGPQMLVSQIFTCVGMGFFLAFAYMVTENFWVPVIIHYLNNNLIPIVSNNYSADVLENQVVNWSDLPVLFVLSLLFVAFALTPVFNEKKVKAEALQGEATANIEE